MLCNLEEDCEALSSSFDCQHVLLKRLSAMAS